jgi:hypothetical protein
VIAWSAQRRLTRNDFAGRVPMNTSISSLSWLNIDAVWECKGDELVATIRATFDPARSWWRSASANVWEGAGERTTGVNRTHVDARRSLVERDLQLLEHEQLHFDLAEVSARQIQQRFDELKASCAVPGGTERLQHVVSDADRELQDEQRKYDAETNHGTNPVAQDQWRRKIRQQLDLASRSQTTTPPRRR